MLPHTVSRTTYALIKDLVTPNKPKDKTFDELIEIVARHYKPKPGKIVSRYKFYTHGRKEGQSVSEFVADLRRLAEHCEFGATLDDIVTDLEASCTQTARVPAVQLFR